MGLDRRGGLVSKLEGAVATTGDWRSLVNPSGLVARAPDRSQDPDVGTGRGLRYGGTCDDTALSGGAGNAVGGASRKYCDCRCGVRFGGFVGGGAAAGAKQVYAVDNDPLATSATLENIERNHLDPTKLLVKTGSVETLLEMVPEPVDGIVCNILADIIVDLIPQWKPIVKPATWGILSGILLDQAQGVTDVLEGNGWFVAALWKRGDWTCLNIRRSPT